MLKGKKVDEENAKEKISVVEGDEIIPQPSPAATLTPYQRLTNALQTDPRCAQEVKNDAIYLNHLDLSWQLCTLEIHVQKKTWINLKM